MSWQAMGAVQEATRFVGSREMMGFRVMLAIAWYADEKGVAGRAGQRTACPSHRTIAERARVHVNTVRNWLPRLEAAGELALERHGAGRGSHIVYRILLPMAQPGAGGRVAASEENQPSPAGDQDAGELRRRLERLEEKVREREEGVVGGRGTETPHETPQGKAKTPHGGAERPQGTPQGTPQTPQERPHGTPQGNAETPHENELTPHENKETPHEKATNATRVQRGHVEDPLDPIYDPDIDPELDPGGYRGIDKYKGRKGHKAPPSPSPPLSGKKEAFQERVQALAEVCGMDLRITSHRRQCEQAAGQLAHYGARTIRQRFGPLPEGQPLPAGQPLPERGREGAPGGTWQWYVDDWRGARKGEQPRPRDVVANISRERVGARPEGGRRPGAGGTSSAGAVVDGAFESGPEEELGPAQIAFREFMREEAARQRASKGVTYAANGW